MIDMSDSTGKASSAVSGSSGRATTVARRASAVASCGKTIIIAICDAISRSCARIQGSSRSRSAPTDASKPASQLFSLSVRMPLTISPARATRSSAIGTCAARAAFVARTMRTLSGSESERSTMPARAAQPASHTRSAAALAMSAGAAHTRCSSGITSNSFWQSLPNRLESPRGTADSRSAIARR